MKDIPLNNPEVLKGLDNFLWMYKERDEIAKHHRLHSLGCDINYYTGDEYRDIIVKQDTAHEGYPEECRSYNMKPSQMRFIVGHDPTYVAESIRKWDEYSTILQHALFTKFNALTVLYPPDGFISWHNNCNASAYNLVFTWSETGDGQFQYMDTKTGETVVMKDRKGWQCKAGYFGSYGEAWTKRVYHSARTDCWRITVSFMFDWSAMSEGIQNDVIDEIMQK